MSELFLKLIVLIIFTELFLKLIMLIIVMQLFYADELYALE